MAVDGNASRRSNWEYHVFLSFRGEDTRLGFTGHLYAALERKGIRTFRDDEELARGEVISQKLLLAIEESLSAVVVISQNYASSTWCLDELQKIVESKQNLGQEVFPVFYGIDPSDVRHQRGSFAEAFRKHEVNFARDAEKVQRWRNALKEVANLSGWDSRNQHEAKLIEEIVTQVWTKLEPNFATYNDGLVAIDPKVEDMYSQLRLGLEDVRFIGIWGMGGIGKTTLADVVFKKIRSQFDVCCFLSNVREASKDGDQGLVQLQNKLLSHSKVKGLIFETLSQGRESIRNLLYNKKVLLVLDDVSAKSQLDNLAGNQEWFGPGSRIIVTTRDKHLFISHRVLFQMYEVKILNTNESLRLFFEKAFKGDQRKDYYLELSEKVVEYAGGLPLALDVLGSSLCGRSVDEWEEALIKISQVPYDDVQNKLKISYDMLEDDYQTIFLDIACFFKGWYKDKVMQILGNCGFHPTIGINVLIEKSLVTCEEGVIGMHDLIEKMGKNIVFQESPNDPGKRSRLWSLEEIDQVLKKNIGTGEIQGIVLKSSTKSLYEANWHPKAFLKMPNLRLLIILCDLHLLLGLECLSSSLKVLIWWEYPLEALPLGVQLDELVYLQICHSKIKILWNGTQLLEKLKFIDLSNSRDLIQTPNIYGAPNLEKLFFDGCIKLAEVHQSVAQHKKLVMLSFIGCINLEVLPIKLEMSSLKTLLFCGCSTVKRLPDFEKNMECVSVLDFMNCENLLCLPNTITNLKCLQRLNISGCSKICKLPDNINENKALEDLDLSRTSIREVNSSLFLLKNMKRLSFSGCSGPAKSNSTQDLPSPFGWKFRREKDPGPTYLILPPFVSGLSSLTSLDLSYCNLHSRLIPQDLGQLSSLERLILSGNKDLQLPTDSIANLCKLRCLEVEGCMLGSQPMLPPHAHLNPEDFASETGLLDLDLCKLWKLFEEHELFKSHDEVEGLDRGPIYSETPPRFDNQNFFPMGPHLSSSIASITVNIPSECHWGEWWGIAVFIALEPRENPTTFSSLLSFMCLNWSFEAPRPEAGHSLYLSSSPTAFSNHYLLTMVMKDDYIYIQRHRKGYRNTSNDSESVSKHWKPEFRENSKLCLEVQMILKRKIRECRWHALSKEDLKGDPDRKMVEIPSDSNNSSGLNSSTVAEISTDELGGEDAAASNAQNGDTFNNRFSLRKPSYSTIPKFCMQMLFMMLIAVGLFLFAIIWWTRKLFRSCRRLCLSMLVLMVAGIGVFLFPRQALLTAQHNTSQGDG